VSLHSDSATTGLSSCIGLKLIELNTESNAIDCSPAREYTDWLC
jgi:hypothetical protein